MRWSVWPSTTPVASIERLPRFHVNREVILAYELTIVYGKFEQAGSRESQRVTIHHHEAGGQSGFLQACQLVQTLRMECRETHRHYECEEGGQHRAIMR